MGIRGLVSYAETVSLYGTESVFVDGDDTPYSKAILAAAYASRGVKMRVSSGAGAEVLMGGAEQCSMLYLESRCVSLARAIGVQGVQNGGIDGASVAGVRAARGAGADGREPHGDGPQPRGLHRQRRADVRVRRPAYVPHPADPAGGQRLRVQRLRQHPALRQHVRAVAVERRGHRRLAGHAARLGRRRWAADGRPRRDRPAAPRGGRGVPGRLPLPRARRLLRRARRARRSTRSAPRTSATRTRWWCSAPRRRSAARGSARWRSPGRCRSAGTTRRPAGSSTCWPRGCTATTCRPRRSSTSRCRCSAW